MTFHSPSGYQPRQQQPQYYYDQYGNLYVYPPQGLKPEPKTKPGPNNRPAPKRKVDLLGLAAEILVTLGVLVLGFVAYEVFWTDIESAKKQEQVTQDLEQQWQASNPRPWKLPTEGTAFARLYIPQFGSDYAFSVVKGVSDADLEKGPGHYLDTQEPGAAGNFAMAGHRVGRGSPFNDLGSLRSCSSIVVETAGNWNVYRVLPIDIPGSERKDERVDVASQCMGRDLAEIISTGDYSSVNGREITVPTDVNVINPIPGLDRMDVVEGDLPLLTMTTCHPQFSNKERMIIHAVLVESYPKTEGGFPTQLLEEENN